jgi:hypothetical protein
MSVHRRIADLIPSHGEGQLMTRIRHCRPICTTHQRSSNQVFPTSVDLENGIMGNGERRPPKGMDDISCDAYKRICATRPSLCVAPVSMPAKPSPASPAENEMTMTPSARQLPVWPFHAWALVALVLGSVFIVGWWPQRYPAESELVKFSGPVATITVRDDISDTSAGAMLPGWASTYFTLEGIDSEFRYPRSHPKNLAVRDGTSGALELWVERSAIGGDEPMVIWQIREHNPYKVENQNALGAETFVSHAEIVTRLTKVDRSMVSTGVWLLVIAFAFALLGIGAKWWNQKSASRES